MASRATDSDAGSQTPSEQSDGDERSERDSDYETDEEEGEDEEEDKEKLNIAWTGYGKKTPVILFKPECIIQKKSNIRIVGERYHLTYKFGNAECKVVRNILNGHGFHEVHPNSNDYSVMWTGAHLKPFTLRSLTEFQKINHFPRSYELTRKDRLYKNIQRMQQIRGVKHFDFIPSSFILPSEYQDFCAAFLKDKGPWIVKPVASSRGRGVFLVNHPDQVPLDDNLIVCKYVSSPFLIDGFKFDVRLYVAVTSYDPLVIYLYEEGLTRFATVKYEKSNRHIRNQCMHLTNYSVNKKNEDYVKNDDPDVEDYGNKWSLGAMLRYLRSQGRDTAALMMRIEDVLIKTIISVEMPIATACKMFMPFRGNCFELYGFDILVDENLKPWVLEVNLSPSLACDSPLDQKIKTNMICDLFSVSGIICHDPMMRNLQQSRRNQEVTAKMAARAKKQRPQSAGTPSSTSSTTVRNAEKAAANSNNNTNKNMQGLNSEEIKILRRVKEEDQRRGGWVRIFPTADSWDLYTNFLQFSTTHNLMVHQRLYPDRHKGTNLPHKGTAASISSVGSRAKNYPLARKAAYSHLNSNSGKSETEYAEAYAQAIVRTRQYERKLGASRTGRRQNRRRGKQKSGVVSVGKRKGHSKLAQGIAEDAEEGENEDNEDDLDGERVIPPQSNSQQMANLQSDIEVPVECDKPDADPYPSVEPPSPPPEPQSEIVAEAQPEETTQPVPSASSPPEDHSLQPHSEKENHLKLPPPPPPPPAEPKYNVVELLQNGKTLSKVQARAAFAMYLIRVQQRLMTDSGSSSSDDVDALNEQMDLVLRFLKRAAVNLQQSFKVVVPSRKLPLNDRRRILAKQLGDFVHIYNKETEQLRSRKQIDRKHLRRTESVECLDDGKFERFVHVASESELEEVLTTYTKINKSASIFLGGNSKTDEARPTSSTVTRIGGHPVNTGPKPDTILAKRRDSSTLEPTDQSSVGNVQAFNGWEDVPRVVPNTSTSTVASESAHMATTASSTGVTGDSLRSASSHHVSPATTSYVNAVHIYSQKLSNRPRSASAGSGGGAGRAVQSRPMSAAASGRSPFATTDPVVDTYNDEAIHAALQRLALRQQARQYSPYNGTLAQEMQISRPSSATRTADQPLYRTLSLDNPNPSQNQNYFSTTPASTHISYPQSKPGDGVSQGKYMTIEERYSRSRPPSGAGQRKIQSADPRASRGRPVQTNLQSANATFNSFVDDSPPQLQNELAMAYNQVTGVLPQNYHTASQSSKQYQLLQQQHMLKQQSKALLEQSKAKHQAMVAQAHAVQKSLQRQRRDSDSTVDSAVQKYAPKPPIQPAASKKMPGPHRQARPGMVDESVLNFNFYNSLKYDINTGSLRPGSATTGGR